MASLASSSAELTCESSSCGGSYLRRERRKEGAVALVWRQMMRPVFFSFLVHLNLVAKQGASAPNGAGITYAVSLTVSRSKSEFSRLSKKMVGPFLELTTSAIMSHEYTERDAVISVARMASVAKTLPVDVLESSRIMGSSVVVT